MVKVDMARASSRSERLGKQAGLTRIIPIGRKIFRPTASGGISPTYLHRRGGELGGEVMMPVMIHSPHVVQDADQGARGHATGDAHREAVTMFRLTGDRDFLADDHFYTTTFTALNGSGVTGEAIVGYDEDGKTITVAISAAGLEPNMVHVQHIHGFPDGTEAHTPTTAQDTDGDGYVELAEGLNTYGPILLNLTTDHSNGSGGDNGHDHSGDLTGFPTAPDGTIWFVETYSLPAASLTTDPMLALREIVIHGETVPPGAGAGTTGEVDGSGGYKLVLPVASGELSETSSYSNFLQFLHATDFAAAAALHTPVGNIDMFS
jgi:hypothetical protein